MEPHVDAPPRKRRRAALSCENCRQKKLKCDRNEPCEACVKSRLEYCVYRDGKRLATRPAVISQKSSSTVHQPDATKSADPVPSRMGSPYLNDPSSFLSSMTRHGATSGSLDTPISLDRFDPIARDSSPDQEGQDALPPEQLARQKIAKYQKEGFGSLHPRTAGNLNGSFSKGRFYGGSHWISYLYKCPSVATVFKCFSTENISDISDMLVQCKVLTYNLKMLESTMPEAHEGHKEGLPDYQTANRLTEAYMLSFETIFPILDRPAFWQKYADFWCDGQSPTSPQFLVQLKLVLTLGSVINCEDAIDRLTICRWIHGVDVWLNSPQNKWRMSLDGLRTRCLLLLARQANGVDTRIIGFDAGSTYQMAMQLGLHIDPQRLQESAVSGSDLQLRRRLWTTVMELELQATMDAGSTPLIREADYDCLPPDNMADGAQPPEISTDCPAILPVEQFTSSSVQILLARSLPLRLEIARYVNDFRSGSRYQETLRLSAALLLELRQAGKLMEGYRRSGAPHLIFQVEVFNLLMHRFVLALHYDFAIQARTDPTFYYSRKMCLDSALVVLTTGSSARDNDFCRLTLQGKGVYEDVYTQAFTFLCDEISIGPADSIMPASETVERRYLDLIQGIVNRTLARLHLGAGNIKGYGLYASLLAYCEATLIGEDVQIRVRAANRQALEKGHAALQLRYEKLTPANGAMGTQAQPSPAPDIPAGHSHEWFKWDDNFDPDADNWLEDLIGLTA